MWKRRDACIDSELRYNSQPTPAATTDGIMMTQARHAHGVIVSNLIQPVSASFQDTLRVAECIHG